jgi:hypothetical protein
LPRTPLAKRHRAARICAHDLAGWSREAGADLLPAGLARVCELHAKWAARFDRWRVVHARHKDAQRYSDMHEPRIARALEDVPMSLLIADVHHVEISGAWQDRPLRAKLLGWLDGASGYLWASVVLTDDRQSVRLEDVARSLAAVCLCPFGGLPQALYLDNGSEYNALTEGVQRLADLAELGPEVRVIRALPYAAESKGLIEGAFGILEGILRAGPGWIGGDRLNKPTASKGKPVTPFVHGPERLAEDIADAVAIPNGTPQGGRLGNKSPRDVLQEKIAATGFVAQVPREDMFDFVFSRKEIRTLRRGALTINGHDCVDEALAERVGDGRLEVFLPLRGPKGAALFWREGRLHRIAPETYGQTDPAGARRQQALKKVAERTVAELEGEADPTADEFETRRRMTAAGPINAPTPAEWSMPVQDKTGTATRLRAGGDLEAEDDAEVRAEPEDRLRQRRQPGLNGKGPAVAAAGP